MSDSGTADKDFVLDVAGAALLGIFTCLAAFAAYQASLWGGNQATAYTSAINTLGAANRELLRGVQDQAFDTTVWIEHMKASDAARVAEAAEDEKADEQADEQADDDDEPSKEERALTLAAELAYAEDEPLAHHLTRVLQSRRELVAAVKWSAAQHEKRTALLPPQKRLELANRLLALFDRSEDLDEQYDAALAELGLADAADDEIALRLEQDPAAKQRLTRLEQDSLATQAEIDGEMDRLAAPMFFESPTYIRSQESKFKTLLEQGNQTFLDGQQFNANGDRFTLATVFYAVALFFAGMGSVLRRRGIKLAFLGLSVLVASGAMAYMLTSPLA